MDPSQQNACRSSLSTAVVTKFFVFDYLTMFLKLCDFTKK